MLNDLSDYDRSASRGRLSRMSGIGEFPEDNFGPKMGLNNNKLKDLYREYCESVNNNK